MSNNYRYQPIETYEKFVKTYEEFALFDLYIYIFFLFFFYRSNVYRIYVHVRILAVKWPLRRENCVVGYFKAYHVKSAYSNPFCKCFPFIQT